MSRKRGKSKSQECQCSNCQNKADKISGGLGNNPFGINTSQLMGMLGNIDMGQIGNILSSMNKDGFDLNNLNMGSIQNIMSGMNANNGAGNDINSMNVMKNNQDLSAIQKMMNGININDNNGSVSIQDMITSIGNMQGINNEKSGSVKEIRKNGLEYNTHKNKNKSRKRENIEEIDEDENLEMLMSIRKIVSYDKAQFIDKIIELYNNGAFEEL